MKILGLNSQVEIAGLTFNVDKITRKHVLVSAGQSIMELPLSEVETEILNGNWKVIRV